MTSKVPYCLAILAAALSVSLVSSGVVRAADTSAASKSPDIGMHRNILYVSTEGRDDWSGKLAAPNPERTDGPLATLTTVRDRIRALRAGGGKDAVTVFVRGGTYALTEPFVLTPEDSGTADAPVVYAAFPGEMPVLSGGRRITGWTRADGQGELWTADVPGVKQGQWYFHQLFVNGQRRQRAKSPNTGFFQVDGQISFPGRAQFRYHGADIHREWANQSGVEVVALCKWQQYRIPIAAVDAAAHSVTLAGARILNGNDRNPRYWVENTPDALDAPGEWYLDRTSGTLYYRPMPGEDLGRAEVIAPLLEHLVELAGDASADHYVHDITLRGFTLEHADWSLGPRGYTDMQAASEIPAAIEARGARCCSIENCVLRHLGQYAVSIGKGSKENRIIANEMTDLGAGGVKIGDPKSSAHPPPSERDRFGPPLQQGGPNGPEGPNYPHSDKETSSGNVIADNDIHDIGAVFASAVGVWIGQSCGNTVAHNEIHDTFYSGISVGWTWGWGRTAAHDNIIEQNHIHHIGRGLLSDMGCIYTLGLQPGTVLRNNLCHDVTRYEHLNGYGAWGIYLDSASRRVRVENNVVYRAWDGAFHHQYGQENVVRNNIFALGTRAQLTRHYRGAKEPSFHFERNIIYWKEGSLLWAMWDDGRYQLDHNLYFRADGQPILFGTTLGPGSSPSAQAFSFEQWQEKRGQDKHSVIADPLLVDPEHGNFSLKPESPAFQLGFQAIDVSAVGPRRRPGLALVTAAAGSPVFDGKTLDGWTFRGRTPDAENPFYVKDGLLCCKGQPMGYLRTNQKYTNYAFRIEWRWPGKPGNNGVLLGVQDGEHFFDNTWPKSIEAQLLNQHAGEILTIGDFPLQTGRNQGRRTATLKPCNEKPQGQWNQFEAKLQDGRLKLVINDELQNEATEVDKTPGYIALQSEGAPIEFRNLHLTVLGK